jgi:hypothetical protein
MFPLKRNLQVPVENRLEDFEPLALPEGIEERINAIINK